MIEQCFVEDSEKDWQQDATQTNLWFRECKNLLFEIVEINKCFYWSVYIEDIVQSHGNCLDMKFAKLCCKAMEEIINFEGYK